MSLKTQKNRLTLVTHTTARATTVHPDLLAALKPCPVGQTLNNRRLLFDGFGR